MLLFRLKFGHNYDENAVCTPRIPGGLEGEGEDATIPRVCAALTTEGCLMSIGIPVIGALAVSVSYQQYKTEYPDEPVDMERIWRNTRYPFTILAFDVDPNDPNVLFPHQISDKVPDAMHCGECWILNARRPDAALKVWLYSATISDIGVRLSNGSRIRMFKVEDASWIDDDGPPDLGMICDMNDAFVKLDKQTNGDAFRKKVDPT